MRQFKSLTVTSSPKPQTYNEDWIKTRSWDVTVSGMPVTTLDQLHTYLGVDTATTSVQKAAVDKFMTLPVWKAAPASLVRMTVSKEQVDTQGGGPGAMEAALLATNEANAATDREADYTTDFNDLGAYNDHLNAAFAHVIAGKKAEQTGSNPMPWYDQADTHAIQASAHLFVTPTQGNDDEWDGIEAAQAAIRSVTGGNTISKGDVSGHGFHGNQWTGPIYGGNDRASFAKVLPPYVMKVLDKLSITPAPTPKESRIYEKKLEDHRAKQAERRANGQSLLHGGVFHLGGSKGADGLTVRQRRQEQVADEYRINGKVRCYGCGKELKTQMEGGIKGKGGDLINLDRLHTVRGYELSNLGPLCHDCNVERGDTNAQARI